MVIHHLLIGMILQVMARQKYGAFNKIQGLLWKRHVTLHPKRLDDLFSYVHCYGRWTPLLLGINSSHLQEEILVMGIYIYKPLTVGLMTISHFNGNNGELMTYLIAHMGGRFHGQVATWWVVPVDRNPATSTPGMQLKPVVHNGISTTNLNW